MKITIIGAGINGLVAANYLQRAGHQVSILERNKQTGGACCCKTTTIDGHTYKYPGGASVFGLMQDFVLKETGLADKLTVTIPKHPDIIYFPDTKPCRYYEDERLSKELRDTWKEQGDIEGYRNDLRKVCDNIREATKKGKLPDVDAIWLGSARQLFSRYFTSELTSLFHSIPVTESSPLSLDEPYGAFNIPLMNSGGRWGFVEGGIWNVTEQLTKINQDLGVRICLNTTISKVDDTSYHFEWISPLVGYTHYGIKETDIIIFATDPVTAGKLVGLDLNYKRYTGSSAKQVFFFRSEIKWKGPKTFRFIFSHSTLDEYEASTNRIKNGADFSPTYFEIYPDMERSFSVFFKDVGLKKNGEESPEIKKYVEELILPYVENTDYVGSVLLTPKDLQEQFYFPQGNIDHMEMCEGQTLASRTFSQTDKFYQFGSNPRHYYCGAGAYPCGSVAGTPGYLCAREILG
jgi:phytoene dehydrogenase-like protein